MIEWSRGRFPERKTMSDRELDSTRSKIVRLLRRAKRSVNDLAAALGLTDNAVRANLARLERDGLVQQAGNRPTVRKPEAVYDITPTAEQLFPKAYASVLATLLSVMEADTDDAQLEARFREVGRRLAAPHLPAVAALPAEQRAQRTLQILEELGGLADLERREDGRLYVRGYGCPFSAVVAAHPKLCIVAEALVSALLGREVREQCDRGDRSKCCFVVQ
jgi:predicted ArsR family transcriptional regulator